MTMSETTVMSAETSSGLFAEAIGGVATIVLTILALSGVSPEFLLAVATIVFGAALLIEGTSMAAQYAHTIASPAAVEVPVGGTSLPAIFAAGVSGIILGVLALLGTQALLLTSISTIVYGSALVLTAMSSVQMSPGIASRAPGSIGAQVMAGIAAIVLGILAVAGQATLTLSLVALLVLGAAILMTGHGMNSAVFAILRNGGMRTTAVRPARPTTTPIG
jgi:hypothetical protein